MAEVSGLRRRENRVNVGKDEFSHHEYLNALGIASDEPCIFNTIQKEPRAPEGRQDRFDAEREQYGFDSRETWSLRDTMAGWIYSHLKMFLDLGGKVVDLEDTLAMYDIPVLEDIPQEELVILEGYRYPEAYQREKLESHTLGESIRIACDYLEDFLIHADKVFEYEAEARIFEKAQCAMKIVAITFPGLWW